MKWTKPFTYERSYQVESHIGSKLTLDGINYGDTYPDDLQTLERQAKACDFEKLEAVLDEIDDFINNNFYNIMDDYDEV